MALIEAKLHRQFFDSMFNNNNNSEESNAICDNNRHDVFVWKFQGYWNLLSTNVKGFQYRLVIGDNGGVHSVVWMTATMRYILKYSDNWI